MSLIHSPPQLDTPWRHLLAASALAVLLPSALGAGLLAVNRMTHSGPPSDPGFGLWAAGMTLMLSPLLSAAGMMLVVPVASLLIRLGWFGWLPAAATGAVVGGVIGQMMQFALAAPFGVAVVLILRAALGLMRPMG